MSNLAEVKIEAEFGNEPLVGERVYLIEKIFTIPDFIYRDIVADPGMYQVRGEDGRVIGSGRLEEVFDDTYRFSCAINYFTPERLLLEEGTFELAPKYTAEAQALVAPVDPTLRVMTYLIRVELSYFQVQFKKKGG